MFVNTIASISIMSVMSGIVSSAITTTRVLFSGGGIWNALKKGSASFLSSAAGTFISLLILSIPGIGQLGGAMAFGIGSVVATYLQLYFEHGNSNMFTKDWWVSIIAAFFVGSFLGYFAQEAANDLRISISKMLDDIPMHWDTLLKIELNKIPMKPKIFEAGLKQTFGVMFSLHKSLIKSISNEVLTSHSLYEIQTMMLVPVVKFISTFLYTFSSKMNELNERE